MVSLWLWRNQLIAEALMIALRMIMRQILPQNIVERILAQDHHLTKRFGLVYTQPEPLQLG
jgi:hypothetical protein